MPRRRFYYYGDGSVENIHMYRPGGYHPVLLGDILPKKSTSDDSREPRYRILQKLGHGGFATVWLARDLLGKYGYVAVKISISFITGRNNEIKVLRWLRDTSSEPSKLDHPGYQNIIRLLDDFTIKGPNGSHECYITEVALGISHLKWYPGFRGRVKEILFQSMLGLSYLHDRGVTHGDLHLGNIAISLPQVNGYSEEIIMENFEAQPTVIVARNPSDQDDSLPPYLVPYIPLIDYLEMKEDVLKNNGLISVKLLDFGNSFREGDRRPAPRTPLAIRPPEVAFNKFSKGRICPNWNKPIDVWAMACNFYELYFEDPMLSIAKIDQHIYSILQMAGPLPPDWQPYWDMDYFCRKSGRPPVIQPEEFWDSRRVFMGVESAQETDQFIELMRQMLIINPDHRPQVKDLLGHPWFARFEIVRNVN